MRKVLYLLSLIFYLLSPSDIEAEEDDVAVLHDVLLALRADQALFPTEARLPRVPVFHLLGANELPLRQDFDLRQNTCTPHARWAGKRALYIVLFRFNV